MKKPTIKINKTSALGISIIILAAGGFTYDHFYPPQLNFTTPPAPYTLDPDQQQGPLQITIPDLNINQPIVPGIITNNIWSVANATANHLATSANPGQPGNIIIYGHDDPDLFGNLNKAQAGQEIILTDHNQQTHRYQITTITATNPTDVSLVQPTDTETLTVYTCTGFANSQRLIIRAAPIN